MTEDEKQALRDSFAGKSVSQMTPGERKIFDADFQYGLSTSSNSEPFKGALFGFGKQIAKFMK